MDQINRIGGPVGTCEKNMEKHHKLSVNTTTTNPSKRSVKKKPINSLIIENTSQSQYENDTANTSASNCYYTEKGEPAESFAKVIETNTQMDRRATLRKPKCLKAVIPINSPVNEKPVRKKTNRQSATNKIKPSMKKSILIDCTNTKEPTTSPSIFVAYASGHIEETYFSQYKEPDVISNAESMDLFSQELEEYIHQRNHVNLANAGPHHHPIEFVNVATSPINFQHIENSANNFNQVQPIDPNLKEEYSSLVIFPNDVQKLANKLNVEVNDFFLALIDLEYDRLTESGSLDDDDVSVIYGTPQ